MVIIGGDERTRSLECAVSSNPKRIMTICSITCRAHCRCCCLEATTCVPLLHCVATQENHGISSRAHLVPTGRGHVTTATAGKGRQQHRESTTCHMSVAPEAIIVPHLDTVLTVEDTHEERYYIDCWFKL